MGRDVDAVVGPDGWITWDHLLAQLHPATVRAWVRSGRLVGIDQGVYATPRAATDWRLRVPASTRVRRGVASHGTALALWDLVPPQTGPVHISVGPGRSGRGTAGVVLHRGTDLDWYVRRGSGIPVTSVERSLVDAWGQPAELDRARVRAAAITAARERRCMVRDLAVEVARRTRVPRRSDLTRLLGLLAEGCRSELGVGAA